MAMTLRAAIRTHLAAWPFNNAAPTPYIELPRASQMGLTSDVAVPLPFVGCRRWKTWYARHNESLTRSSDYFTTGTWCGYYADLDTHGTGRGGQVVPPMTGIRFRATPVRTSGPADYSLQADNCRDGAGPFNISGNLVPSKGLGTREVRFEGIKHYTNSSTTFLWDLRATPFGLTGFWGNTRDNMRHHFFEEGICRLGLVWLWKESWTQES
ncbi:hypothetical protein B0A55_08842 [Friedmanniomyces simplex]|uniref:Uncharacterized protein n=1 Tax=Friedmanniomyces simplex TaxID=329884 RepID=A0A4U0X4B8_9PEZI|nr:hypothetical protein B0A55_08842 [Friedmanniomyces simplex]